MIKRGERSKSGQITIFVIIALALVVSMALLVMVFKKPSADLTAIEDPHTYVQKCIDEELVKVENKYLEANLFLNITDNYILYKNEKVKYLCKAWQFYLPCTNQEPMLVGYVRNEMEKTMKPKVEVCFNNLVSSLKRKGYEVKEGNMTAKLDFGKSSIIYDINKKITMSKASDTRNFENFRVELISPMYRLVDTARIIVNYESTICEFNNLNWMMWYPDISIKRFIASDQTKVYTLTDKVSEKEINIAIKSCVLPAGL